MLEVPCLSALHCGTTATVETTVKRTDLIRYDEAEWELLASDVLHPTGRPEHERGLLLRNRRTGILSWLGEGGAMRAVDPRAVSSSTT